MLVELMTPADRARVLPLISNTNGQVVMGGVASGLQAGRVYVDDARAPQSALVWARNEMFYLVGRSGHERFNRLAEQTIVSRLLPGALHAGEDTLNLETYPLPGQEWDAVVGRMFGGALRQGWRIPFCFREEMFEKFSHDYEHGPIKPSPKYQLRMVDPESVRQDAGGVIVTEILKFWHSLDDFYRYGFGTCVLYRDQVVGTCISVFVHDSNHEVGIVVYGTEHRGQGLATAMAHEYVRTCLKHGCTPHWTTEHFRHDSAAIARKLGFEQGASYPVHYAPIRELLAK